MDTNKNDHACANVEDVDERLGNLALSDRPKHKYMHFCQGERSFFFTRKSDIPTEPLDARAEATNRSGWLKLSNIDAGYGQDCELFVPEGCSNTEHPYDNFSRQQIGKVLALRRISIPWKISCGVARRKGTEASSSGMILAGTGG